MCDDVFLLVLTRIVNLYTQTDPNHNCNRNPNAKLNPKLNPSSATQQFLRIEGDDSAAHGELTAAIIENE